MHMPFCQRQLLSGDETLCKHESGNLVMGPVGTVTQYPPGLWGSCYEVLFPPKLKFRLLLAKLMPSFLDRDVWL